MDQKRAVLSMNGIEGKVGIVSWVEDTEFWTSRFDVTLVEIDCEVLDTEAGEGNRL